jgi:large subunit ribosomal protein L19
MKIYPHNLVRKIVEGQLKLNIATIQLGDTIRVKLKFQEIGNRRTQFYVGTLQAKNGTGRNSTRTIQSEFGGGIKTERTFYLHAPSIEYSVI